MRASGKVALDPKKGRRLRHGTGPPPSAQGVYAFIETQKANHRIGRMCRALRVSKTGFFYGWQDGAPSARGVRARRRALGASCGQRGAGRRRNLRVVGWGADLPATAAGGTLQVVVMYEFLYFVEQDSP
jgi:hypothetical protein